MKTAVSLIIASFVFAVHGIGAAATTSTANAAPAASQVKKPKKKIVRKRKPVAAKPKASSAEDAAAITAATELYKKELAQRISNANPDRVHNVQPQALLRSVVVMRLAIDANGKLVSSTIQRSNHDPETEGSALASVRNAEPLPKPPAKLLVSGQLELSETWLFNDDGRFQIRSVALAQRNR